MIIKISLSTLIMLATPWPSLYTQYYRTVVIHPRQNNRGKPLLKTQLIHNGISKNHNFLGCKQPPGLDVNQPLNAKGQYLSLSCNRVTGSVGATYYAHATQTASLRSPQMLAATSCAHLVHHNSERLQLQ